MEEEPKVGTATYFAWGPHHVEEVNISFIIKKKFFFFWYFSIYATIFYKAYGQTHVDYIEKPRDYYKIFYTLKDLDTNKFISSIDRMSAVSLAIKIAKK